jgi:hypothetical protein
MDPHILTDAELERIATDFGSTGLGYWDFYKLMDAYKALRDREAGTGKPGPEKWHRVREAADKVIQAGHELRELDEAAEALRKCTGATQVTVTETHVPAKSDDWTEGYRVPESVCTKDNPNRNASVHEFVPYNHQDLHPPCPNCGQHQTWTLTPDAAPKVTVKPSLCPADAWHTETGPFTVLDA